MADGRNIDALLQRSEELTANLYGGDELPRVKRNLTQVLDAGKRLWSKTAAHGTEAHQVKAALLLGKWRKNIFEKSFKSREVFDCFSEEKT